MATNVIRITECPVCDMDVKVLMLNLPGLDGMVSLTGGPIAEMTKVSFIRDGGAACPGCGVGLLVSTDGRLALR